MSQFPVAATKLLIKSFFDIEVYDLNSEEDYLNLNKIAKRVKCKNKTKMNLLIVLLDELCKEGDKLKSFDNQQKFQEFKELCQMLPMPKDEEKDKEYKDIKTCLGFGKFNNEDIYFIYKLMKLKQSNSLLFHCIEEIYSDKDKFYVKNSNLNIPDINFYTFLFNLRNLFVNESDNKSELYTFDFKEKKFFKRNATSEEIEKNLNISIEMTKRDILNFIKKYKKEIQININKNMELKQKNVKIEKIEEKNDIIELKKTIKEMQKKLEQSLMENNKNREKEKEKYENEKKDLIGMINKLKMDLSESNKNHELYKKEMDTKYNKIVNENLKMGKKFDVHYKSINELKKEINNIKSNNNSLLNENNKIKDKIETIKREKAALDMNSKKQISELTKQLNGANGTIDKYQKENVLMKSRDTAKYIIDFLYIIIIKKLDFSKKYVEKVDFLCDILPRKVSANENNFINCLCVFLRNIQDNKIKGDRLTHGDDLRTDIFRKDNKLKDFFMDYLDIKKNFQLFKSLYRSKSKNEEDLNIENVRKACVDIDFFSCLNSYCSK